MVTRPSGRRNGALLILVLQMGHGGHSDAPLPQCRSAMAPNNQVKSIQKAPPVRKLNRMTPPAEVLFVSFRHSKCPLCIICHVI